jgi:hypothetical protein
LKLHTKINNRSETSRPATGNSNHFFILKFEFEIFPPPRQNNSKISFVFLTLFSHFHCKHCFTFARHFPGESTCFDSFKVSWLYIDQNIFTLLKTRLKIHSMHWKVRKFIREHRSETLEMNWPQHEGTNFSSNQWNGQGEVCQGVRWAWQPTELRVELLVTNYRYKLFTFHETSPSTFSSIFVFVNIIKLIKLRLNIESFHHLYDKLLTTKTFETLQNTESERRSSAWNIGNLRFVSSRFEGGDPEGEWSHSWTEFRDALTNIY